MDSISKPVVTQHQLSSICEKDLGGTLVEARELTEGWFNAAYLLTSDNGQEAVLKTAPLDSVRVMRYERNLMQAEVSVLRTVKEKTCVPAPAVIVYDKTREVVDSDYFLAERVPGKPLDRARPELDEAAQSRIDEQVGKYLKEIHTLQGSKFGAYNEPVHSTWAEGFECLMNWLRQDAVDLEVELPTGAFEASEPYLWALDEVEFPTLVHWDLWDGNIFVDPATGGVTGLIDFERALWADPLIEANFSHPRPHFLDTYGHSILQAPGARERRLLYDLYLHLIIVIECRFRGFTADHEAWARDLLDKTLGSCRATSG